ncbi:hypothetical protein FQN54_004938 [Arachnomyces sp. PD_36]|nr:hypothetical protein FQN54_004938 [Arachnomyces sp. PD_36]
MGDKPKPQGRQRSKSASVPRPSSSIILLSPKNEVLLLSRVKTSRSFASAHVFPGGNLSSQDGECPAPDHPKRHDDAIHYRRAAIRELFEESGILLARDRGTGRLVNVGEKERESGRHRIHRGEVGFQQWLGGVSAGAEADTEPLTPFTHWITPTNIPRRFTTQMYVYFLPIPGETNGQAIQDIPTDGENEVQVPTSDGGLEVTEIRYLPPSEWLRLANSGEIIMFPPQYFLLHLIAEIFANVSKEAGPSSNLELLNRQRSELLRFIHSSNPPWTDKFISPKAVASLPDGRLALGLDYLGPELEGSGKKGEADRVVATRFTKEGPREVEVMWRKDVLQHGPKSNL